MSDVYIVYDLSSEIMKQEAVSISKDIPGSKNILIGNPINDDKEDSIIIAIGDTAVEYSILERNNSCIIATYIPRINYYKLIKKYSLLSSNDITAIFIDPSVNYQLELIKQLYPHNPSAITFVGQEYEFIRKGLEESSKEQGVSLEIIDYLNDRLMFKRIASERRASALLTIADANIFNINNFRSVLEVSYSSGIGVIGYSESMVKAGSVGSAYIDFHDEKEKIFKTVDVVREKGCFSMPESPERTKILINTKVLKSFGHISKSQEKIREE
ncbi:MAG: hypothetical protein P8176_09605, partial [Gammaproteobacteria bacterium]